MREDIMHLQQEKDAVDLELARLRDVKKMQGIPDGPEHENELERKRRELMILQVEKSVLARRYNFQTEELRLLAEKEHHASNELVEMERVLKSRIVELESKRAIAESRARSTEEMMSSWVPREELSRLSRSHESLKARLADALAKFSKQTIHATQMRQLKKENLKLHQSVDTLQDEMKSYRERAFQLQKVLDSTISSDIPKESIPRVQMLARLGDLETREKSASRKNARLTEQLELAQKNNLMLEDEVRALEERLQEVQSNYLVEHEMVSDLRNKLEGSLDFEKANKLQKSFHEAALELGELRAKCAAFQNMADIAAEQAKAVLESQQNEQSDMAESERESLRQAVRDLAERSDEQNIIGKLHHALLSSRMNERTAERKLTTARADGLKLQSEILKLEAQLDMRDTDIHRLQKEYRIRKAEYEKELLALQSRKSDGISLAQAEILNQTSYELSQKLDAERAAHLACKEKVSEYKLKIDELEVTLEEQKDLTRVLGRNEEGDFVVQSQNEFEARLRQKVTHYNEKVRELRLSEMQLNHKVQVLQNRNDFLSTNNGENEAMIAKLQQQVADSESTLMQREQELASRKKELDSQEHRLNLAQSLGRLEREDERLTRDRKAKALRKRLIAKQQAIQEEHPSGLKFDLEDDLDDEDEVYLESVGSDDEGGWGDGGARPGVIDTIQWASVEKKLRNDMLTAKKVMDAQKKTIEELQRNNAVLTKTIEDNKVQLANDSELNSTERQRILSTAQQTIASLHKQLAQKNEAIARYQQMLESARLKYQARKEMDEAEIERLNEALLDKGNQNMGKLQSALSFLDGVPKLPEGVITIAEMDDQLNEKKHMIEALHAEMDRITERANEQEQDLGEKLRLAMAEGRSLRDKIEELEKQVRETKADLTRERARSEANAAAATTVSEELNALIAKQEQERAEQQEQGTGESKFAPSAKRHEGAQFNKLVTALKSELRQKEDQVKTLETAILELKNEMLTLAEEGSSLRSDNAVNSDLNRAEKKWMVEKQRLNSKIESLNSKITKDRQLHKEQMELLEASKEEQKEKDSAVKALKELVNQQARNIKELEGQLEKTNLDYRGLRERSRKWRVAAEGKGPADVTLDQDQDSSSAELVNELERQLVVLQEQNKQLRQKEQTEKSETTRAPTAFERWDTEKRLSKQVDSLKKKISEKNKEILALQKKLEVVVNEKEKLQGMTPKRKSTAPKSAQLSAEILQKLDNVEDIRSQLFDEREKVFQLTKVIEVENKNAILILEAEKAQLAEQLEKAKKRESEGEGSRAASSEEKSEKMNALLEKQVQELQNQLLQANCDKLDLRYDQQHHQEETSSLRSRLEELQEYKAFVQGHTLPTPQRPTSTAFSLMGTQAASEDFIIDYPELDNLPASKKKAVFNVISTLRRVIDKQRRDSDSGAPSSVKYMELVKQNKKLRKQIEGTPLYVIPVESAIAAQLFESAKIVSTGTQHT